jgi:hypothetical protein
MNNSLKKFQAWRSRREQRSLERWERIRAEGKLRFVVQTSLTYGLSVVGVIDVFDRIFDGTQNFVSLRHIIYYVLVGIAIGFIGWSDMEAKYRKALHKARLPALSSGDLTPHNNSLRITSD